MARNMRDNAVNTRVDSTAAEDRNAPVNIDQVSWCRLGRWAGGGWRRNIPSTNSQVTIIHAIKKTPTA